MALHVDQFNAVLLQLFSSCRSGHGRRASNWRFRNGVGGRGAKFARRQFTTLRRCISEALSTSQETIDGRAFIRLVLQHHPYYGKTIMVTAIVRRLSPDSVASKDRRIVANIAMNMIKRWVSQASDTVMMMMMISYADPSPSAICRISLSYLSMFIPLCTVNHCFPNEFGASSRPELA
jgi:hypothetical protein